MSQDKVRAKEATVQITESGVRLGGSMIAITNVRIDPEVEVAKTRTSGEARARGDLDIKGYNFSFESFVKDRVWFDLWNRIQTADEEGDPLPEISLAITIAHRTGASLTFVIHGDTVMHLAQLERPEDGYLKHNWSGFASYMDPS